MITPLPPVFHVNQAVTTPNGPGRVNGCMWEDGHLYVIVRHTLADMTGKSAGTNQTPSAIISGLWSYLPQDII